MNEETIKQKHILYILLKLFILLFVIFIFVKNFLLTRILILDYY